MSFQEKLGLEKAGAFPRLTSLPEVSMVAKNTVENHNHNNKYASIIILIHTCCSQPAVLCTYSVLSVLYDSSALFSPRCSCQPRLISFLLGDLDLLAHFLEFHLLIPLPTALPLLGVEGYWGGFIIT